MLPTWRMAYAILSSSATSARDQDASPPLWVGMKAARGKGEEDSDMSIQVSRDPFARTTLFRKRDYDLPSARGCTWCGQMRHTPKGRPYLYRYQTESDGGRPFGWGNPFCSLDCERTYTR